MLSTLVLGERVRGLQWAAIMIGLIGTIVAADPSGSADPIPILLGLAAGLLWGITIVLTRKNGSRETTSAQLIITGLVFCLICGSVTEWRMPVSYMDMGLLVVLGIQILLAQMLFFEGYRFAPASILAPLEYQVVVWSCMLGWMLFGEVPTINVLLGAAFIIAAGIGLTAKRRTPQVTAETPRRRRFGWMSKIQ